MAELALGGVIAAYLLVLSGVAVFANVRKRKTEEELGAEEGQFGGSFSAPVLALTTTSTIFSGATVVGIPSEVATLGYLSIRWYLAMCAVVASMLLIFPRLRALSVERGYKSPTDFVSDRFQSRFLTMLLTACCAASSVIYLTIQFNAFGGEVMILSGGSVSLVWSMVAFSVLVLVMEALGGLASVVYTDVVQGIVTLVCFLAMPFILRSMFGLPSDFVPVGCMAKSEFGAGCVGDLKPEFLEYPARETVIDNVFWFTFGMLAFPLNLQLVQRCILARSDAALRVVMLSLLVAAGISYTPGIYMGLVNVAFKDSWPEDVAKKPTWWSVTAMIAETGTPGYVFVCILNCAYLAAVMSTADSVIMGVTATVSRGIRDFISPNLTDKNVARLGMLVSAFQCALGVIGGLRISPPIYGKTLALANSFLYQVVPAYLLGLFTAISTFPIVCGACVGTVTSVACYFFKFSLPFINDAMLGAIVNVAVVLFIWAFISGERDMEEAAVGAITSRLPDERLSLEDVEGSLRGRRVPRGRYMAAMVVLAFSGVPVWEAAGSPQKVMQGLPWFGVVMLCASSVSALIGIVTIVLWHRRDVASERTGEWYSEDQAESCSE